jgi:hypothetical protein
MSEQIMKCPSCGADIKLTDSLAASLSAPIRKHYEKLMLEKDKDVSDRERAIREKEKSLADEKAAIEEKIAGKVNEQLKLDRIKIAAEESKKAKLAMATDVEQKTKELAELQEVLKQRDTKLAEAQKAQADLLKKQRELDDAKRELELTVEKRVQSGLVAVRDQAKKEAEEDLQLKVKEKEQTISSMQKQIEELRRRAEQGSQQLQGEVQELEIEELLRTKFPFDTIEPVPKGEHGGDALQRVVNSLGQICGTIIWESKRTKNWSDGWLPKLREDQRAAKAEIAIIVTQALPKDVDIFDHVDGVWVIHPKVILPIAMMLRHSLIEIATARQSSEGQQTKMELVYHYLTGPNFRQRVQAIVEAFSSMQDDLMAEKKVITRQWSKRETQIDRVMQSTVGMYGDLQGIAGKSLPEIEALETVALEAPDEKNVE